MSGDASQLAWGAQSVRATYFAIPTQKKVEDLFQSAFGRAPDAYQGGSGGILQASGVLPHGQAILNISPGRYDITLAPSSPTIGQGSGEAYANHLLIMDVSSALSSIKNAISSLGGQLALPTKCAIGVDFAKPTATLAEANTALTEILPYGIGLTDEQEFMLQRNDYFTISGISEDINCLSRWSVNMIQQMTFSAPTAIGMQAAGSVISSYFIAQKFIDVNTRAPLKAVKSDIISKLFDGLIGRVETLRRIS